MHMWAVVVFIPFCRCPAFRFHNDSANNKNNNKENNTLLSLLQFS